MTGTTRYDAERRQAIEAGIAASSFSMTVRQLIDADSGFAKVDRSPVTIADFGAQALICQSIASRFPDDPIVAEETSEALRHPDNRSMLENVVELVSREKPTTAAELCRWIDHGAGEPGERFWTVDPLDGTRGFLRGDQFAIAIALLVGGNVELGVLVCPALPHSLDDVERGTGMLFVARRGQGWEAFALDGSEYHALDVDNAVARRMVFGVEPSTSDHALQEAISRRLELEDEPLRLDSQAKYAAVARGDAALYLRLPAPATPHYREKIWDHAAGALLVQEAGGVVTDGLVRELDFSKGRELAANSGVIASRCIDHAQVLQMVTDS